MEKPAGIDAAEVGEDFMIDAPEEPTD